MAPKEAAYTKSGEQQERLCAIQARCNARLGRADQARAAITQARKISDSPQRTSDLAEFGGTLCFPRTKLAYYLGSAHRIIGEYRPTQQQATEAIRGYTTGLMSDRSYGDEALARCDIAITRVVDNHVDGASEILNPCLRCHRANESHP